MRFLTRVLVVLAISACASLVPFGHAQAAAPTTCEGCNFSGSDLHGVNFSNVDYTGTDFKGTDLRHADFRNARLVGVDFSDADMRGADLTGAELTGCDLRNTKLAGAKMANMHVTGVKLRGLDGVDDAALRGLFAHCTGCDARGVDIAGKDLSGIDVVGADFQDVDARGVRFANADLVGADFSGGDLRKADFRGAAVCWHNVETSGVTIVRREVDCIDLRDTKVAETNFKGALQCDYERGTRSCTPVDAATLRQYTRSPLEGAELP